LFFIDELVYFRCRTITLFEFSDPAIDSSTNPFLEDPWSDIVTLLPMTIHMEHPLEDFQTMLLYYSKRALTNQEDVLNAMGGIIQRLSRRMKCRFFEGLPTAMFDLIILFTCDDTPLRRRRGFLSYSWAGWRGAINWSPKSEDINKWLERSTWIVWYKRRACGTPNLVWHILANENFPHDDNEYIGYRQRQLFHSPVTLPFPTGRTRPTEELGYALPVLNYPVLQFWTLAAFFGIRIADIIKSFAWITDRSGTTCGALYLDDVEGSVFFQSAGPYELIATSATRMHDWYRPKIIERDVFKNEGLHEHEPYYTVMVLMWSEGVAERREIGFARQKDIITESLLPGLCWKEILLD
jgi:hypothetical protein